MGVNKNFVVKNGIEVNNNLVFADANNNLVGIATTTPNATLNVVGGIGATHLSVTGVGTFTQDLKVGTSATTFSALGSSGLVGVGTASPAYLLDVRSEVSTGQTALYVQGDVEITGDLTVDDISFDQATINFLNVTGFTTTTDIFVSGLSSVTSFVGLITNLQGTNINYSGIGTFGDVFISGISSVTAAVGLVTNLQGTNINYSGVGTIANLSGTNINYTGVGTIDGVEIRSGVVTATSGIVTYYGDASNLTGIATGLTATIGVGSETSFIGAGITQINFATTTGTNVAVSVPPDTSAGIATVTFTPGVSLGLAIALGG